MSGLDAVLVRNVNGKISVTDDSVFGYGPANSDRSQDVKLEGSKLKNGVLQVKFSRPVETSDKQADLPLTGCSKFWEKLNMTFGIENVEIIREQIKFILNHSLFFRKT